MTDNEALQLLIDGSQAALDDAGHDCFGHDRHPEERANLEAAINHFTDEGLFVYTSKFQPDDKVWVIDQDSTGEWRLAFFDWVEWSLDMLANEKNVFHLRDMAKAEANRRNREGQ